MLSWILNCSVGCLGSSSGKDLSCEWILYWFKSEIDEDGKGIGLGSLIVAVEPSFSDEGQLETTSYSIQPFQLTNIKRW